MRFIVLWREIINQTGTQVRGWMLVCSLKESAYLMIDTCFLHNPVNSVCKHLGTISTQDENLTVIFPYPVRLYVETETGGVILFFIYLFFLLLRM